jgi:hypothetical protein
MKQPVKSLAQVLDVVRDGEWGFTGTRAGMSMDQRVYVRSSLVIGTPTIIRHGGADGSDTEFHAMWREELSQNWADVWPASELRAKLFEKQNHVTVNPVMDPLDRNVEIVKRSSFLIATPQTQQEVQRSGTWATVRAARRHVVPVLIIWPNGMMTLDLEGVITRVVK